MSQFDFIKALKREAVDTTPIWLMRQAGRYLPEYRSLRESVKGFMGLCTNPELATQVTLQPLKRFDLDAAILFSDILTIPDAMGLGLYFTEGEGPRFQKPLNTLEDIHKLKVIEVEESLSYVTQTIKNVKAELKDKPLIGFSGSPWTLATYMVEGASSKTFSKVKKLVYEHPFDMEILIDVLTESVSRYLIAQAKAGADALMIFDTWGGVLSFAGYPKWSLKAMEKCIKAVKKQVDVPIIIFTKQAGLHLSDMATRGADAIGVDWTVNLKQAFSKVGHKVALQGNLDPAILLTNPSVIKAHVADILESVGPNPGHIFNLGHGIAPNTPPDHVAILIESVHEMSQQYRSQ